MNWKEFENQAPELAAQGLKRFQHSGMILLGSLRKNGWPRISPVEVLIVNDKLYLGMMWQSMKALDLLRDPRCTIHNTVSNKDGSEGEFKLYGYAQEISDLEERRLYAEALFEAIGYKPEEPEFHLFAIDILSAAFTVFQDEEKITKVWKANEI